MRNSRGIKTRDCEEGEAEDGAEASRLSHRGGRAIALTVADVEVLKRRISVPRDAVQVGREFEVGPTKGKDNRCPGWRCGANVLAVSRMPGH